MAHFSEDSGESSNQEDDYESEAGESEGHDTDEFAYLEEQLERRANAGACAVNYLNICTRITKLIE